MKAYAGGQSGPDTDICFLPGILYNGLFCFYLKNGWAGIPLCLNMPVQINILLSPYFMLENACRFYRRVILAAEK